MYCDDCKSTYAGESFSVGTPNFNQVHCGDETVNLLIKVRFSVGILNCNQVHCGGETHAGERVFCFVRNI